MEKKIDLTHGREAMLKMTDEQLKKLEEYIKSQKTVEALIASYLFGYENGCIDAAKKLGGHYEI